MTNRPSLIRWKALLVIFALFLCFLAYVRYFFDSHLKEILEGRLSTLNGAQVDIGSLRTRFLDPYVELKKVHITHPRLPEKNLFSIEHFSFNFALKPLFRRKFLVTDMTIKGLSYFTARELSGNLPDAESRSKVPSLLDRADGRNYEGLRKQFAQSPLPILGRLKQGWNLNSKVATVANKLTSLSRLRGLQLSFDQLQNNWQALALQLDEDARWYQKAKTMRAEEVLPLVRARRVELENAQNALETAIAHRGLDLKNAYALVAQDIRLVRNEVQLPNLEIEDLSLYLFGPHALELLERATYWIDWLREHLPSGTKQVVKQTRERGISLHFAKEGEYPLFLLAQAQISSDATDLPGGGNVRGSIEGFTSDPSLYGRPMRLRLSADFPSRGVKEVTVDLIVDHTEEVPKEKITLSVAELPLEQFPLSNHPSFRLLLARAKAGLTLESTLEDTTLRASVRGQFTEASYSIDSKDREADDEISRAIVPVESFGLEGKMEGALAEISLQMESELGRQLAAGLRNAHRPTFLVVDDAIRSEILDVVDLTGQKLRDQLDLVQRESRLKFDLALKSVKDAETLADKEVNRLSSSGQRPKRAPTSRARQ